MTMSFPQAKELLTRAPAVYTTEDVERVFGVTFTPEQRRDLENVAFTEDVLRACAGTHMLLPGFGLSLLEIRERHSALFHSKSGGWYAEETHSFSRVPVPVRWHLLRMEPVPGSFGKTWAEQQSLLLPDEEVPSAAVVAFATMLHFGATKERLVKRAYVRTSDVDSDGVRVYVGDFADDAFNVYSDWDDLRDDNLGLASARKF